MQRARRATRDVAFLFLLIVPFLAGARRAGGDESSPSAAARQDEGKEPGDRDEGGKIAEQRMTVMRDHVRAMRSSAAVDNWPEQVEPTPIFRYDDQTRGYVDGTVWRLGATGRPLAIITAELHPNYLGGGPCVIYDFLSLAPNPFQVTGGGIQWRPPGSAVEMRPLPEAPAPLGTAAGRLTQMKKLSLRFAATQDLEETDRVLVHLRRLPREIDRYVPNKSPNADGGIFLFVNGRNPAVLLLIESDGTSWQYGVGRLSAPSTLTLKLDDKDVWTVPRASLTSTGAYTATNVSAKFP